MLIDPRQPNIEEWIRGLDPCERFVMVSACRIVFARCANDPWWRAQSKIAADACDLAGHDRGALVEKAHRIAADLDRKLKRVAA